MAEPLLALEAVSLADPRGGWVFRGLDWRLERGGRFHAAAGAGGGCSALLRLCAGLAEPDAGRVLLDGLPLTPAGRHPFLERGALGWVPTDGGLAMNLTLVENVALPLRFAQGLDSNEAHRRAWEWLERAGLEALAERRPALPANRDSWLAALARAGAMGARLWLVDRPAGSLDGLAVAAAERTLAAAGRDPEVAMVLVGADLAHLGRELRIGGGRVTEGGEP
jgi:predicted ABC-type transport system involved in lysophospholipase L1 biosynthesis ATPase subunit